MPAPVCVTMCKVCKRNNDLTWSSVWRDRSAVYKLGFVVGKMLFEFCDRISCYER